MNKNESYVYYESNDGRFGVKLSSQTFQALHELCAKFHSFETGGILIGNYSSDLKWAEITAISGAPTDSRQTLFSFTRNDQGIIALLRRAWKKQKFYLGEWHYHPDSSPRPSALDMKTMFKLSDSEDLHCPESILLIVGGSVSAWRHYIGVYTGK